MYRRPKFLEMLLEIRRQMALEADYDVDLFVGALCKGDVSSNSEMPDVSSAIKEQPDLSLNVRNENRKVTKE